MVQRINLEDLVKKVIEIAQKNPNVVYDKTAERSGQCHYMPSDANPEGCIMGFAFREIGVDLNPDWEGLSIHGILSSRIGHESIDDYLRVRYIEFLDAVQMNQDKGNSWGKSVEMAIEKNGHPLETPVGA